MPPVTPTTEYDYDLVVIGGGSGGLACAKEAREYGLKVAVLDYVHPSTQGTTWGLGGTCVNVGCIPKKLYHTAAILGEEIEDARKYGWQIPTEPKITHDWATLRQGVTNYIKSLNWIHRVSLRNSAIDYHNMSGSFVDPHTLKLWSPNKGEKQITSRWFVISVGGRPVIPENVPGAKEFAITSDDIFHMENAPGKTLVVGASYVALECAGFLTGLGYDTTVMVRSILLRGFDQQMAGFIHDYMEKHGTKFVMKTVPDSIEKTEDGKLKVSWTDEDGQTLSDSFDCVLYATGRRPATDAINLAAAGVNYDLKTGYIPCDDTEKTNVEHVFAIGDVVEGKPELTPVAARTGRLLARRLAGVSTETMNYRDVATTVFTPLEYGSVGLSEESAIERFGADNIDVWHGYYKPHTFPIAERPTTHCYIKYISHIPDNNRIVGMHMVGPMAGEVIQGFSAAIKCGLTKALLDETVGIHPTIAEEMVKIDVTKRSGKDPTVAKCCG